MSRADRNKHMIDARNQWASTKDGVITFKTADVKHAYAVGFSDGIKLNKLTASVNNYIVTQIDEMAELNLAEMYLFIIRDTDARITEIKTEMIDDIERAIGHRYTINQINKWFAGTTPIPSTHTRPVAQFLRKSVMQYLLGDDVANKLSSLF